MKMNNEEKIIREMEEAILKMRPFAEPDRAFREELRYALEERQDVKAREKERKRFRIFAGPPAIALAGGFLVLFVVALSALRKEKQGEVALLPAEESATRTMSMEAAPQALSLRMDATESALAPAPVPAQAPAPALAPKRGCADISPDDFPVAETRAGANFAGHYAVRDEQCGTNCWTHEIKDIAASNVAVAKLNSESGAEYTATSGLLIINSFPDVILYEMRNGKMEKLCSAENDE